jgi:beta-lactamase class A
MIKQFRDPQISKSLKRIIFFDIVFLIVFSGVILILDLYLASSKSKSNGKNPETEQAQCPSSIILIRESTAELTHPLFLTDVETESRNYFPLKGQLTKTIQDFIQKGKVNSASVYLRQLSDASWMSIGGDQTFFPGSLMKVPIMIYYLKQEELSPGFLNKEFLYVKPKESFPKQAYIGDSIKSGSRYKISELLHYMIEESDNNATYLLSKNLKPEPFRKIFTDLNIPPDEINDIKYEISPREYSKFFRVLYSATYINERLSQYGLDLLAHCRFTEGLARNLPEGTIVARKFGEHGANENLDFSEAGIVYKDNNPYLLIVMTNGTNHKDQTDLISEISDQVFKSVMNN